MTRLRLLLLVAALTACTSVKGAEAPAPAAQRDLLTRAEILNSPAEQGNALQAIRSLRPTFLTRSRSAASPVSQTWPIAVYINGVRATGLDVLQNVAAVKIAEIRYMEPTAAESRFGAIASGGALLVKLYDGSQEPPEVRT